MSDHEELTYYSVISYVPDPVRGETLNIGVLAVSDDGTYGRTRFAQNWNRVAAFGSRQHVGFLRMTAKEVSRSVPSTPELFPAGMVTHEYLEHISADWRNIVQFSQPRSSLLGVDQVVEKVFHRFVERPRRLRERHKSQLVQSAIQALDREVKSARGVLVVERRLAIDGKHDSHELEIGLKNGEIAMGADAISFKAQNVSELRTEIDAVAWLINDVRDKHPSLPLYVLATNARESTDAGRKEYRRAERIYGDFQVPLVPSADLADWAVDSVRRVCV
jgi:Protein of unknown function (DUF3037)